jgi:hypothetical protein
MRTPIADPLRFSIAALGVILALGGAVYNADAARVGGVLSDPAGQIAGRQLHFQNQATRDIYMAVTDSQGRFSTNLPPGIYDLRGQRGTIFVPTIPVASDPVNLGTVSKPTGWNPLRIFQLEGVAPVIVRTPAPSTAYLANEEGVSTLLPAPPVTGTFSQKGGAGGAPSLPPASSQAPPASSQLMPVPN